MKKINKLLFLVVLFVVVSFAGIAMAAIDGEGLTISPPISELSLKPGESRPQTIRLTNPTQNLVEVYPRIMNFKAAGEGGEPSFYEEGEDSTKFSLSKWISFNQSKIALAPEQVAEFNYTINVPEGAEPGGHYGVVFFATEPPEAESGSSQVALGSMIGSLVLVKVPGQIVEKGFIEEFFTDKGLYFTPPVNLSLRITNLGNVHFKPKGSIKISGWFGAPKEKIQINEQGGNILPDSIRLFDSSWEMSPLSFGYFKAQADVVYGDSEKNLLADTSFWIIPWWLIIIIVALVALIVYFIVRKRKKKKGKKTPPPMSPRSLDNRPLLR